VNEIGKLAEAANHHPDLAFGWGYLRITLTSHDKGSVTDRDRRLAAAIDKIDLPKS
jgi:4a-hydroxytetrahydrobiopterin dehydratase